METLKRAKRNMKSMKGCLTKSRTAIQKLIDLNSRIVLALNRCYNEAMDENELGRFHLQKILMRCYMNISVLNFLYDNDLRLIDLSKYLGIKYTTFHKIITCKEHYDCLATVKIVYAMNIDIKSLYDLTLTKQEFTIITTTNGRRKNVKEFGTP
jgi:hypothetical protein